MRNRKDPVKQLGRLAKMLNRCDSVEHGLAVLLQETAAFFGAVAGRIVIRDLNAAVPVTDASGSRCGNDNRAGHHRTPPVNHGFFFFRGRKVSKVEAGEVRGGLIEGVLGNRRAALVKDAFRETGQPLPPIERLNLDIRSAICVPIGNAGALRGAIELLDRRADGFETSDLDVLEAVAALAEACVTPSQRSHPAADSLETSRKETEAALRRVADLIGWLTRGDRFEAIVEPVLQGIRQTCGARRVLWVRHDENAPHAPSFQLNTECAAASAAAVLHPDDRAAVDVEALMADAGGRQAEQGRIVRLPPATIRRAFAPDFGEALAATETLLAPVIVHGKRQGAIVMAVPDYCVSPASTAESLLRVAADVFAFAIDRDRSRSDRSLLELQVQNAQKLESLGELASGISHNFRNILAGIIANCQLMEMRSPDRPDLAKNLAGIHNLARIGSDLVDNLLKFARKGTKKEKQIFNLAEVLEETVQIITPSFDKKIAIHSDWENPLPMEGVRSELSQLVMNLCTNARDAMNEGGILQVTARPMPAVGKLYLAVSDTGCGMTDEIRKRIFDPFFTTKDPGRGTGLGLSTAYGIIRDHEGEITVKSKPGVGSIFQILFPMAVVRGVEKKNEPTKVIEGGGEKILVIDDDRGLLQTVESLLNEIGYQTITTDSGQRGVELYCSDPPDAVLIDRSMPEIDGLTAAGEILDFDPDARILIVSGYEEEGPNALKEPIKSQIRAYITKPFDISDLSRVLAEVLRDGDDPQAGSRSKP